MLKKTIEYTDFNGTEIKEDFFFHMSVPEATRFVAKYGGENIEETINKLVKDSNLEKILQFLEEIILSSYGEKTLDGKAFYKDKERTKLFEYSNAYALLFEELLTNDEKMTEFATAIGGNAKANNIQKFTPKNN